MVTKEILPTAIIFQTDINYLCLSEKLCILSARNVSLLTKKSQVVTKCCQENKFFATNQKKQEYMWAQFF